MSLPPRSYELAAKLFASALDVQDKGRSQSRLDKVAHQFGESVGAEARVLSGDDTIPAGSLEAIEAVIGTYGYEPYRDDSGGVRMRNCPFHSLASDHREMVCRMNLQLMDGIVKGLGVLSVRAVLEPRPNECCVAFQESSDATAS